MNDVITTIASHRSIRKFKNMPLSEEQVDLIVRSAQMAPTSAHLQTFSIIGITDTARKKELAIRSENPAIAESGYCFIFCADLYRVMTMANDQEKEKMKDNLSFNYFYQSAIINTSIALQNANLAAESLGLGTVIMAGVNRALPDLDEWLDLPEYVIPLVGLAVGVPDDQPEQKPRLPESAVFFENRYNRNLKDSVKNYDAQMAAYYKSRSDNTQDTNWTKKNIQMLAGFDLPLGEFTHYVRSKGFDLK